MKNEEIKKHIEIAGAILTDKLIETVCDMQARDNDMLHVHIGIITNAICYIASQMSSMNDNEHIIAAGRVIADLSIIKDVLHDLRKP